MVPPRVFLTNGLGETGRAQGSVHAEEAVRRRFLFAFAPVLFPFPHAVLAISALCWLCWLCSPTQLVATDRFGVQPRWVDAEEKLREHGFDTDPDALMRALQAPSSEVAGPSWHPAIPVYLRLEDSLSDVKVWSAEVLGLRGDRQASDALLRVAREDANEVVRTAAWIALARLGSQEAQSAIEEMMHRAADLYWRLYLAARLAEVGNAGGYRYVLEAASGPKQWHRLEAASAVVGFVPLQKEEGLAEDPLDVLLRLALDGDPQVRQRAVLASGLAVAKGASQEAILELLGRMAQEDPDAALREQALAQARYVGLWCEELEDTEPVARQETCLRPLGEAPLQGQERIDPE